MRSMNASTQSESPVKQPNQIINKLLSSLCCRWTGFASMKSFHSFQFSSFITRSAGPKRCRRADVYASVRNVRWTDEAINFGHAKQHTHIANQFVVIERKTKKKKQKWIIISSHSRCIALVFQFQCCRTFFSICATRHSTNQQRTFDCSWAQVWCERTQVRH